MLFNVLVDVYERLKATPSRLEKTALIADFIGQVPPDDLPIIVTFLTGRIFPGWDQRKTGIASQSMIKIISTITHNSEARVVDSYKHSGQFGLTAEEMFGKAEAADVLRAGARSRSRSCTQFSAELARLSGAGSATKKQKILMRHPEQGHVAAGGQVHCQPDHRERALGRQRRRHGRSDRSSLRRRRRAHPAGAHADIGPGRDGEDRRSWRAPTASRRSRSSPCGQYGLCWRRTWRTSGKRWTRWGAPPSSSVKYDGARLQIHKKGNEVRLYSRRLEDLTDALPEIVDFVRQSVTSDTAILDSECIAIDRATGRPIPFQNILTRLRRIYKVEETRLLFPLNLRPFDVLYNRRPEPAGAAVAGAARVLETIIAPLNGECKPGGRADHRRRDEGAGDVRRVSAAATRGSWAKT